MIRSLTGLFADFRTVCLCLCLVLLLGMTLFPTRQQIQPVYRLLVIVDITRSMNAEDYQLDGHSISRLQFVKHSLVALLGKLPCQSQLGLGVFTERRSTLLFEPIEICSGYTELTQAIEHLDWRMAWAADSRIASGLLHTLQQQQAKDAVLLFLTDGQEAPPLNNRYRTDFAPVKNKVKGILIGTGGLQPVAIPKFNAKGQREGNYGPDDVPHRSSFGESDLNPEKIEGYDARNAPFGKHAAIGNEHQSALQEAYLQQLASDSGLLYQRLFDAESLAVIQQHPEFANPAKVNDDIRPYYAVLILLLLLCMWL